MPSPCWQALEAKAADVRAVRGRSNAAMSEGMKTLRMVGIDKAKEGITTLEEVLQVTAEDH
jgi:type II secretory ATPase GspE/PulE/Tfp pilus assembly ATPase PilB-like protein